MAPASSISQAVEAQSVAHMECTIPGDMTIEQWRRRRSARQAPAKQPSRLLAAARRVVPLRPVPHRGSPSPDAPPAHSFASAAAGGPGTRSSHPTYQWSRRQMLSFFSDCLETLSGGSARVAAAFVRVLQRA